MTKKLLTLFAALFAIALLGLSPATATDEEGTTTDEAVAVDAEVSPEAFTLTSTDDTATSDEDTTGTGEETTGTEEEPVAVEDTAEDVPLMANNGIAENERSLALDADKAAGDSGLPVGPIAAGVVAVAIAGAWAINRRRASVES